MEPPPHFPILYYNHFNKFLFMPTGSLFRLFFPLPVFPAVDSSFHLDLLQRWIRRSRFIPGRGSVALLSFLSIVRQHNVDAIVDLVQGVPLVA